MIKTYSANELTNLYEKFTGIKNQRSLLNYYCTSDKSKVFIDENKMLALLNQFVVFLDCDFEYELMFEILNEFPDNAVVVTRNESPDVWIPILKKRWGDVKPWKRYYLSSDKLKLADIKKKMSSIPDGFELRRLSNEDIPFLDQGMVSFAFISYGTSINLFDKIISFGLIDKELNIIVSTCSGYPLLGNEDEIDIFTREEYRKRGLGSITAYALMESSLMNDRTPIWDAAHELSRDMAMKLGFSNPISYHIYRCQK